MPSATRPGSVRIWVRTWVFAHRHPLPFGELVPIRRSTEPRPVAGRAHATERDGRLVVHGLVVNVDHPRAEPLRERETARDRVRVDGAGAPVLAVTGERGRLVAGVDRTDRCDRAE